MSIALLLASFVAAAPAAAAPAPSSLVLIVASNRGSVPGRPPLQYADDDGAKYHEVFAAVATGDDVVLLTDFDRDTARLFPALVDKVRSPSRVQLDQAVARLSRRSAELRRAGHAVRFYFVFAGHGDVDQGRGFLELSDGPFTADDLQGLLRSVGATESHVVLDSCNSFFVVSPRRPGGRRFATPRDVAEAISRRLPDVGVFLSTSAQAEVYEWSELQSGVFSHAVRSGLMGAADVDGDGLVSYEELAAFVDTAVAGVKNPLFRPTVFARGPNGQDRRPFMDLRGLRAALRVNEPSPVRLSVRDADGLRWLDTHTEAGSAIHLWFPDSVAGRLEVERLRVQADTVQIESRYTVPASGGARPLAGLPSAGSAVAMRGAGDVFRALFAKPYGPAAYAAYLDQRISRIEEILRLEPLRSPTTGVGPEPDLVSSPQPGTDGARRPVYFVFHPGGATTWLAGGGALANRPGPQGSALASLAIGWRLNGYAALEAELGYRSVASTWSFAYPSVGYSSNPIPETRVTARLLPASANLRLQLPWLSPRPHLILGGGVAVAHATFDPPGFNATLRATRPLPFAHGGLGLTVDLGARLFAGVEARYFLMTTLEAFRARLGQNGMEARALLGFHP